MMYPFCRSLAGNQIEELPAGVFNNNSKLLNLWVGRLKVHNWPTYFYCHILLQILVNSQILKYYCTLLMSPATIVLIEEPYLLVHFLEYHNIYLSATEEGPTTLIETISKPRRRRQRGHGKTIAQHVRFKKLTFLSRPMQNNNVKSPQFASSASQNRDGKLFLILFGTQRFFYTLCWNWGVTPHETVNTCSHFWNSNWR